MAIINNTDGQWEVTPEKEDILLKTANTYLDRDIVIAACPKPPAAEDAKF